MNNIILTTSSQATWAFLRNDYLQKHPISVAFSNGLSISHPLCSSASTTSTASFSITSNPSSSSSTKESNKMNENEIINNLFAVPAPKPKSYRSSRSHRRSVSSSSLISITSTKRNEVLKPN